MAGILSAPAHAYRPFNGTDADVAEAGEYELEFGPLGYLRHGSGRTLMGPAIVNNLGLPGDFELVLEGRAERDLGATEGQRNRFADTAFSVKHVLRKGIRLARQITAQAPFTSHLNAEIDPGPDIESDGALDAFIRERVGTLFHPVGTCAMGRGERSVVDPTSMRVHGVDGLRVVDASIMPGIVSANTVAATYCLAEKAADLIRATDANSILT